MINNWLFLLRNLSHRLSVRAGLFALLAVASSLAAAFIESFIPEQFLGVISGSAVDGILNMMASSMLIVLTFSLSTMVTAYSSAIQVATPRAAALIIDDSRSHSAISIFLGAFIFSVVSLVALSTKFYGQRGRVVLLGITILVLLSVIWVVIKWVGELKLMGSVSETIRRVEKEASRALSERMRRPSNGCRILSKIPSRAFGINSSETGYIQNIDLHRLSEIAEKFKVQIFITNDVGSFVSPKSRLVSIDGSLRPSEQLHNSVRNCFCVGSSRTFSYDPRYGVIVLAGIGIKALSPSLNDPGTAIDVVASLVRVLIHFEDEEKMCRLDEVEFQSLHYPRISTQDLFNDAFYSMTKEGSNHLPVIKSLQEGLKVFCHSESSEFRKAALKHYELVTSRARHNNSFYEDLDNINSNAIIGEAQRH